MLFVINIGKVNHLQNQIRFFYFFQCGAECLDQTMGQIVDKSNRIRQIKRLPAAVVDFAHRRFEGGKQHVLFQNLLLLGKSVSIHKFI